MGPLTKVAGGLLGLAGLTLLMLRTDPTLSLQVVMIGSLLAASAAAAIDQNYGLALAIGAIGTVLDPSPLLYSLVWASGWCAAVFVVSRLVPRWERLLSVDDAVPQPKMAPVPPGWRVPR